ncbi:MAG: helix-turn-helix domain-containing protein [Sedimentisphaerales bacterium]|nr:helix-turn-helix domain-containing protein [Sedimentisphaerales bacterium]
MLTVNHIATLLDCSPRTVYRLIDQKSIPQPVKFGRIIRWPKEPFMQWITDGCPKPK